VDAQVEEERIGATSAEKLAEVSVHEVLPELEKLAGLKLLTSTEPQRVRSRSTATAIQNRPLKRTSPE
jgi:hypothetical protein